MILGVPTEVKVLERRVAMLPATVQQLINSGHQVLLQSGAGDGSGLPDDLYIKAGAKILASAEEVYAQAETIVKVKEPIAQEYDLIRPGQTLFTFLHFASSRELTEAMVRSRATCIAYETVEDPRGALPLLIPMSEVAGRLSIQVGAHYLQADNNGFGTLLGGVPGAEPSRVLVLGAGVAGTQAAKMASGLGARTYLLDVNMSRLRYLSEVLPSNVYPLMSNPQTLDEYIARADLVISSVLIPGALAPKLITRDHLKLMRKGSVIVDICIDQGGGMESSRPTTLTDPIYVEEGVTHYCVTNMPGAVPRTSTIALCNSTAPYVLRLANEGLEGVLNDPLFAKGLNMHDGHITYKAVADAFGLGYTPQDKLFK